MQWKVGGRSRCGCVHCMCAAQNINLDIGRVIQYRQFGNKLWNATKFALLNFPPGYEPPANLCVRSPLALACLRALIVVLCLLLCLLCAHACLRTAVTALVNSTKSLPDQWILHRLAVAVEAANKSFEAYDFAALCEAVHTFWYTDFCDNYLVCSSVWHGVCVTIRSRLSRSRSRSLSLFLAPVLVFRSC